MKRKKRKKRAIYFYLCLTRWASVCSLWLVWSLKGHKLCDFLLFSPTNATYTWWVYISCVIVNLCTVFSFFFSFTQSSRCHPTFPTMLRQDQNKKGMRAYLCVCMCVCIKYKTYITKTKHISLNTGYWFSMGTESSFC